MSSGPCPRRKTRYQAAAAASSATVSSSQGQAPTPARPAQVLEEVPLRQQEKSRQHGDDLLRHQAQQPDAGDAGVEPGAQPLMLGEPSLQIEPEGEQMEEHGQRRRALPDIGHGLGLHRVEQPQGHGQRGDPERILAWAAQHRGAVEQQDHPEHQQAVDQVHGQTDQVIAGRVQPAHQMIQPEAQAREPAPVVGDAERGRAQLRPGQLGQVHGGVVDDRGPIVEIEGRGHARQVGEHGGAQRQTCEADEHNRCTLAGFRCCGLGRHLCLAWARVGLSSHAGGRAGAGSGSTRQRP